MAKIIGLTCHYTGNHDNSAALLSDGKVIFAESEERITRVKHDRSFPLKAIKHAVKFGGLRISDIDYFVSASPPTNLLKLMQSYFSGLRYTNPLKLTLWLKERLFLHLKSLVKKEKTILPETYLAAKLPQEKLFFVSHYLAHAETAFSFSGMDKCLVVTWDGYGLSENGRPLCGSIYSGENNNVILREEIPVYSSMALYYGAVTIALGFKLNDGEGKTMGLAAYGKKSGAVDELARIFPFFEHGAWIARSNWLEVNGVSRLDYFKRTGVYKKLIFLIEKYGSEQVAYAAQAVLEKEGEKFFKYLVKKYDQKKVAVAGGLFLNVKFNMRLLKNKIVDDIFVYPNPSDGGVAVGAAIAFYKKLGGEFKNYHLESAALGCGFNKNEIIKALGISKNKVVVKKLGKGLYKKVAFDIARGKVVGWFYGRGEWGPRALGQRSVLADPRNPDTRERINKYLKQRDWFMPFAPVILDEFKNRILAHSYGTPFMTLTDDIRPNFLEKIPSAAHVDGTARAQIVKKTTNLPYWKVVDEFYKLTGIPVLLNTSFNRHGLPIVHSPKEAIEHLLWGCIDELAIEGCLVTRKEK